MSSTLEEYKKQLLEKCISLLQSRSDLTHEFLLALHAQLTNILYPVVDPERKSVRFLKLEKCMTCGGGGLRRGQHCYWCTCKNKCGGNQCADCYSVTHPKHPGMRFCVTGNEREFSLTSSVKDPIGFWRAISSHLVIMPDSISVSSKDSVFPNFIDYAKSVPAPYGERLFIVVRDGDMFTFYNCLDGKVQTICKDDKYNVLQMFVNLTELLDNGWINVTHRFME